MYITPAVIIKIILFILELLCSGMSKSHAVTAAAQHFHVPEEVARAAAHSVLR